MYPFPKYTTFAGENPLGDLLYYTGEWLFTQSLEANVAYIIAGLEYEEIVDGEITLGTSNHFDQRVFLPIGQVHDYYSEELNYSSEDIINLISSTICHELFHLFGGSISDHIGEEETDVKD